MALYLQTDAVDDYFTIPSGITYDKIEVDCVVMTQSGSPHLFDLTVGGPSNAYFKYGNSSGYKTTDNYTYLNTVPKDSRLTLVFSVSSATFTTGYFCRNRWGDNGYLKAKFYKVTFSLNGVAQAIYDMTTGTVQDQSGNGKHATLTGGTWLDDGTGTTGQTYTVNLSDTITLTDQSKRSVSQLKTDAVTLSDGVSKRMFVTVADTVSLGDSAQASRAGSQSKTLNDTVLITDTIVQKIISIAKSDMVNVGESDGQTVSKKLLDQITATDSITANKGKAVVLTDAITVTDAISKSIQAIKSDSITLADSPSKHAELSVYDVLVTTDDLSTYLPGGPRYNEVIQITLNITQKQTLNLAITKRIQTELKL